MPLVTPEPSIADENGTPAGSPTEREARWVPWLCLLILTLLYFVPTCVRAAKDKLWFDEIYTFDAAGLLPHYGQFWTALKETEAAPPVEFVAAWLSESVFGRNEFGLRFPSVVAFWLMALCLYAFLKRRIPWQFAMAAMPLACLTAAGPYAWEGRPYAIMLAFGAAALLAWQRAAENRHRWTALPVLACSLGGALLTHTMAVALALPLAAGEIARTFKRKRIDWPVWLAFALSTPALIVLWKIKVASDFGPFRHYGSCPGISPLSYLQMLMPAVAPFALTLLLAGLLRRRQASASGTTATLPVTSSVAVAAFALIPFVAVPLSLLADRYWLRYSLNCTIGIVGLLILLIYRIGGGNRLAGVSALAVLARLLPSGNFCRKTGDQIGDSSWLILRPISCQVFDQLPTDAPIVICSDLVFVELEHYLKPEQAARLYYLTDRASAAAIDGDTLFEVRGSLIQKFFPFHANFADYHAFVATHKRFYVVRPIRNIVREYLAGRMDLKAVETSSHFQYYVATPR